MSPKLQNLWGLIRGPIITGLVAGLMVLGGLSSMSDIFDLEDKSSDIDEIKEKLEEIESALQDVGEDSSKNFEQLQDDVDDIKIRLGVP